jgi:uncharacterized protein (DUF433 family)
MYARHPPGTPPHWGLQDRFRPPVYNLAGMIESEPTQTVPLTLAEDGTLRVTGSRVTLDSVIQEYNQGATAEEIQADFPSLGLAQICSLLAYYLDHRDTVEEYLCREAEAADKTRRWIAEHVDSSPLRQRIRERRW